MISAFAAGLVRPDFQASRYAWLVAATLLCGLAGQAQAQTSGPWYLAGAVTGSALNKPDQTIANAPTPGATLQATNAIDFGWGGQLAVGRAFGSIRIEAEVGRTENKSTAYSAISPIQITLPQDGNTNATRYMANAYYDLPNGSLPLRFYVGAGLGAARAQVTTFAAPARAPNAPPSQLLDYSRTVFAYQLMGGVSHDLSPKVAVSAQYRWFDAGTIKGHDSRGERATRDMAGSNFDLGLRYRF